MNSIGLIALLGLGCGCSTVLRCMSCGLAFDNLGVETRGLSHVAKDVPTGNGSSTPDARQRLTPRVPPVLNRVGRGACTKSPSGSSRMTLHFHNTWRPGHTTSTSC
jgi:hypothetical protein